MVHRVVQLFYDTSIATLCICLSKIKTINCLISQLATLMFEKRSVKYIAMSRKILF